MRLWLPALLLPITGCGMYYSRVGGTAHDKLYRGTMAEVAHAVGAALKRQGYQVDPAPAAAGETIQLDGQKSAEDRVSIRLSPGPENLVQTTVGSALDWRRAIEVHRWIAVELGVLYRRQP